MSSDQRRDPLNPLSGINPAILPVAPVQPITSKITNAKSNHNYLTRLIELSSFLGAPFQGYFEFTRYNPNESNTTLANDEVAIGTALANGGGLLIGFIIHAICIRFNLYKDNKSQNPLYRSIKTLMSAGIVLGMLIASFLPLPTGAQKLMGSLLGAAGCLVFGLLGLPYMYIRQKVFKITPATNKTYSMVGRESWSKYAKTLLVYFAAVGQLCGAFIYFLLKKSLTTGLAVGSGIAGFGSFVLGLILVPLFNKFSRDHGRRGLELDESKKDVFRNNYIRSGMTLGLAIGTIIGFIVGSAFFPWAIPIAATIGGAFGSTIGGIVIGKYGFNITTHTNREWKIQPNTDNSWDYATRTSAYAFASIGTLIGLLLPVPGGAMMGALIGGAIGSAVGYFAGFGIVWGARKIKPETSPGKSISWTQRVGSGSRLGTMIGSGIGALVGIPGGPLGMIASSLLFGAIGGIVGSAIGAALGKETRNTIKEIFIKSPPELREGPVVDWVAPEPRRPISLPTPPTSNPNIQPRPQPQGINFTPNPRPERTVESKEPRPLSQHGLFPAPKQPRQNPCTTLFKCCSSKHQTNLNANRM